MKLNVHFCQGQMFTPLFIQSCQQMNVSFSQNLQIVKNYDWYLGDDYIITPKCLQQRQIECANKTMKQNVVVLKIPYSEVSNQKGGLTINIGG